jgi:hypothetical protein
MSDRPYYQESWFEYAFLGACFFIGYFLFKGLIHPFNVNGEIVQTLAMARLMAEGRWLDAFTQFNMPPVYPMLLALVIKSRHTMDLRLLLDSFYMLNFSLYMASIVLVHYFVRRQIHKPYIFAITGLYALSPFTFDMIWGLDAQMTYVVLSMGTLLAIDISISQSSALGSYLSRKEFSICGSLMGLTLLTMQVGYTLLAAFLCILIKRLGLKRSLSTIGMLLMFLSPFVGRDIFCAIRRPEPFIMPTMSALRDINRYGLVDMVRIYTDRSINTITDSTIGNLNLRSYDQVVSESNPSGPSSIDISQRPWARWLLAILAITGAVYGLYLYTGIGTIYLMIYTITALVLLPFHSMPLSLVLPLLLFCLYYGVYRTADWFRPLHFSSAKILGPVLTGWILLCSFSAHLADAHGGGAFFRRAARRPDPTPQLMYFNVAHKPEGRLEEAQTETSHRRATEWLKSHLSPRSRKKAQETQEAHRMKIVGTEAKDTETKTEGEEPGRFDYLVEESDNKLTTTNPPGMSPSTHGLQLMYEDSPGKIRIWRINSDKQTQ